MNRSKGVRCFSTTDLTISDATDFQELSGQGVTAVVDGRTVMVGRSSWLTQQGVDMGLLKGAAHEAWMAALPYEEGFTAKIPVLMASAQAKYWAVPRVVGSEIVDPGDGTELDAWVVELDWWGMGADNSYFPGGGRNDTAGTGGTYWILKDSPTGVGRVFRVRTEIDENTDVVVQMQGGTTNN